MNELEGHETKKFFKEKVEELEELKFKKRELEQELTHELLNCRLSINDALIVGIVKPGFATPTGFRKHLWELRRDIK